MGKRGQLGSNMRISGKSELELELEEAAIRFLSNSDSEFGRDMRARDVASFIRESR